MRINLVRHQAVAFFLTFVCFSLYHASRKAYSNVKDNLSKEWTPISCNSSWPCPSPHQRWHSHLLFPKYSDAEPFLGALDTGFLICYAVGLYISGILGDRYPLRTVLAIGMWLSACMVFVFGCITEWFHFYNKSFYLAIWCLNGLLQSTGWPCVVAIIGNWFGRSSRGLIFGIWSSCSSVGNIIGSLVASAIIDYGYEIVFLYASCTLFCGGFVAYFGIIGSPTDVGLEDPSVIQQCNCNDDTSARTSDENCCDEEDETRAGVEVIVLKEPAKAINFFKAIRLPGVLVYAIIFATLKMVNYSFIFWLPYYLTNKFGWMDSVADNISIWYDVGSIFGGIIFGLISDRSGRRAPVLVFMLLLSPFSIWLYRVSPSNVVTNGALMAIMGVFTGGASNIVGTAVTTDLGKQPEIGSNTDALSTVTGIIDGTGSVGAAIGQTIVPLIQLNYGWNWVFNFFIIVNLVTLLCLIQPLLKDIKAWNLRGLRTRIMNLPIFKRFQYEPI